MTTVGEQLAEGFLFVEGLLSILGSQNQRLLSNAGRLGRRESDYGLFLGDAWQKYIRIKVEECPDQNMKTMNLGAFTDILSRENRKWRRN